MIIVRNATQRGKSKLNWLESYHTFSFADYYDAAWMSFGSLRVINEDFIQAGQGFGMHAHHDMEIITYVINGALTHEDSMGNGSIIKPGEIQRMSAGTGVKHSEFNHSAETVHLLQIWIMPEQKGIEPSYEQKKIQKQSNQLILLGGQNPSSQAVKIHQKTNLYVGYFNSNSHFNYALNASHYWLQLIKGEMRYNEHILQAGDGMAIQDEKHLTVQCTKEVEFLFFEMF